MKILNIIPDKAHLFKDIMNKEHVIIKFIPRHVQLV